MRFYHFAYLAIGVLSPVGGQCIAFDPTGGLLRQIIPDKPEDLPRRLDPRNGLPGGPVLTPMPAPVVLSPKALLDKATQAADNMPVIRDIQGKGEQLRTEMRDRIAGSIGGKKAQKFVADFDRITKPLTPAHADAAARGMLMFIKTGDFAYLNPTVFATAGEIKKARDDNWNRAKPVDRRVIAEMPDDLKAKIANVRVMRKKDLVGELSLPWMATNRIPAICLIDVIVFRDIPSWKSQWDKHLWAHEFAHVLQYQRLGVDGFAREFMGHELRFSKEVNPLEKEADVYACAKFRVDEPGYIGACP
ncbi:DUF4157 domain-containing protein [Hyphomicrobium sp.]|uniref:eCIS core domain-containing protein n=1 Tax=Hyphomicrobium sp. TaxID=82 RepID=UPI0025C59C83|nr:DUF4157 domain-containing protein [Hyphomicrobium sp.]MCC7254187.1 DUF4157 domain-containing protein [Hyphomicrobium sp.]